MQRVAGYFFLTSALKRLGILACVAVCCSSSLLQRVAACCILPPALECPGILLKRRLSIYPRVRCIVLQQQRVAACCSVWERCSLQNRLPKLACNHVVKASPGRGPQATHCVAVCCSSSLLQASPGQGPQATHCVAVCCSNSLLQASPGPQGPARANIVAL